MKGHLRERSPGHWAIILDIPDPQTGKRRRKWHSFKGTKREAQVESAKLIATVQTGNYLEPTKTTLAVFLARWLEHMKSQVTPKSHERYSGIVNQNLSPALGAVHLTKLKPAQISATYSAALTSGRRNRAGGLAPRTVGHMHRVLKQALGQAVRWELLARNPADAVDPPQIDWRPMQTYDLPQTAELIEAVRKTPLLVPAILAVLCGLRRGEICALRWRHVDLAACQLSVVESLEQTKAGLRFKSPKSGKGRTVALASIVVDEFEGLPCKARPGTSQTRRGPIRRRSGDRSRGWIDRAADLHLSALGPHDPHHETCAPPFSRLAARSRDPSAGERGSPQSRQ